MNGPGDRLVARDFGAALFSSATSFCVPRGEESDRLTGIILPRLEYPVVIVAGE